MAECRYNECKAECCGYVSVPLNTPRSRADFDEIKWFVTHENVSVYKDNDNKWIVEFVTPCKYLSPKTFKCAIYNTKPIVCSAYSARNCTANCPGSVSKVRLTTPDEVDKFISKRWK